MPEPEKKSLSFFAAISASFCAGLVAFAAVAAWIVHMESSKAALASADTIFGEVSDKAVGRFDLLVQSIFILADAGSNMPDMALEPDEDPLHHPAIPYLLNALELHEAIVSIYAGYDDGDVLGVLAVRDLPALREAYGAPPGAWCVIWSISGNGQALRVERMIFLDRERKPLGRRENRSPDYDPRTRPWFSGARHAGRTVTTKPYAFHFTREMGVTSSRALLNAKGVFAADISLQAFSDFLRRQKVSDSGGIFMFTGDGRLVAHPEMDGHALAGQAGDKGGEHAVELPYAVHFRDSIVKAIVGGHLSGQGAKPGETRFLDNEGRTFLVRVSGVAREFGLDQYLAVAAPLDEFTAGVTAMRLRILAVSGVALALFLALGLWIARRISSPLEGIEREAETIRRFDFSPGPPIRSRLKEIRSLIGAVALMKDTIKARTDELSSANAKLGLLVEQGIALAAERDTAKLVEMIFLASMELACAEGGVLYLLGQGGKPEARVVRFTPAALSLGGAGGADIPPACSPGPDTSPVHPALACLAEGKTVILEAAPDNPIPTHANPFAFDPDVAGRVASLVAVPLRARRGEMLGALTLVNAKDPDSGLPVSFSAGVREFVEALAAQAALALETASLLREINQLMDSFILLLAHAIDAKSPYTGGHCSRVPVIAAMLARAAHAAPDGPFAAFRFETPEEWREFHVAAWLHDCGKVTTPEFVVDKATKLETRHNRIHEIRTRFEVLARDLEIESLRRRLTGVGPEAVAAWLDAELARLHEDFAFVASLNRGGETLDPAHVERLKQVASRTWTRTFDDQLGISLEEERRLAHIPKDPLPATEQLLADKPAHLIERERPIHHAPEAGFVLKQPECLNNIGEIYNLSISRGTLNAEERYAINDHIIQTITMLRQLPFPREMRRVPEYAGAHHETMTGAGYPLGLKKEEMSIPARIMAIADIFEALTAGDRPYKAAKSLEESLAIMRRMSLEGHIDPDLFDLFLTSGIPEEYAKTYLAGETPKS